MQSSIEIEKASTNTVRGEGGGLLFLYKQAISFWLCYLTKKKSVLGCRTISQKAFYLLRGTNRKKRHGLWLQHKFESSH
jgi:hypothetical protein